MANAFKCDRCGELFNAPFTTSDDRTISLITLRDIVDQRCYEYMEKYHVMPQFIKLPMWIYKNILKYHDFVLVDRYTQKETVCGLALCPTICIENPCDIEVF